MCAQDLLGPGNSDRKLPTAPVRVLGIDLGTTNSTVADVTWDPADPSKTVARCLEVEQPTLEGLYTNVLVPSVVAIYKDRVFVGEGAKRLRAKAPELGVHQGLFYECKNHMGIQRTYHKAPEGFRSAAEIGGKVLSYLKESALADDPMAASRIVVTVPASFQATQRADTLRAAELAGLEVRGGDLLDEPVAAFLDYLVTHRKELLPELTERKTLVVFDFGGGTCDVAIFRLEGASQSGGLKAASLSVSRYHRLGGGDIDAAILYEVLLPELLAQNNLSSFALTYKEKKEYVEPALLGVAEALKVGISTEIARLEKFGRYEGADKGQIVKKLPGVRECDLRGAQAYPPVAAAHGRAVRDAAGAFPGSRPALRSPDRLPDDLLHLRSPAGRPGQERPGPIGCGLLPVGGRQQPDSAGGCSRRRLLSIGQGADPRGRRLGADGGCAGRGLPRAGAVATRQGADPARLPREHRDSHHDGLYRAGPRRSGAPPSGRWLLPLLPASSGAGDHRTGRPEASGGDRRRRTAETAVRGCLDDTLPRGPGRVPHPGVSLRREPDARPEDEVVYRREFGLLRESHREAADQCGQPGRPLGFDPGDGGGAADRQDPAGSAAGEVRGAGGSLH